jgi:hypothetical protein
MRHTWRQCLFLVAAGGAAGCVSHSAGGSAGSAAGGVAGGEAAAVGGAAPVASTDGAAPVAGTGGVAGSAGSSGTAGGLVSVADADAGSPTSDSGNPDAAATVNQGGGRTDAGAPLLRADFGLTANPAQPPPPVSGGTLAVFAGGRLAVASDPDRDHVYVVDLTAWRVAFDVALGPHDETGRVVEGPNGRTAYVALRRGGAVVTIDATTGTVIERRAVCAAPRGLAYDAAAGLLHVACAGGELISLPPVGTSVRRRVKLDDDLRDVIVSGTNLLVSRFRSAEFLTVSAAGQVTARLLPLAAVFPPLAPAVAWRLRALADGTIVMVHQRGLNNPIPIDGKPDLPVTEHPGTYTFSSSSGCGAIVQTVVTVVVPGANVGRSITVAGNVLPVDMAIDPTTGLAAVIHAATAHAPADTLPVALVNLSSVGLDCSQPVAPTVPVLDSQSHPGFAFHPPGQPIAIETVDRSGGPVGGSFASGFVVQTREPATLWFSGTGRVLPLSDESHADVGHAIFHADINGLACASCHPEGGEDGRVWKFSPIGGRRTPSLRGGLAGTEPFHWDGDLPSLSALMAEVFTRRMAGPRLAADQTDALLRWLDAIPALPAVAADGAAVKRGQALFNDPTVGCASCHAGAHTTNNTTVDVGTGKGFQVPSLRGLAWRAPYLHDGCAATLLDRFGPCGGGEQHGHTAQLDGGQLADLVSYLQSL